MSLIHKFKQGNNFYVIDVNSGAVHLIDELIFDLLTNEDKLEDIEKVKESVSSKYKQEDIEEAYGELKELVTNGILFSEDLYAEIAKTVEGSESFIKALCLNIAHDCNLRCKYCFADEGEYKGAR